MSSTPRHPADADCFMCGLEQTTEESAVVFRDPLWTAQTVPGYDVPRWFVLRARRHAERITGLDDTEAAAPATWWRRSPRRPAPRDLPGRLRREPPALPRPDHRPRRRRPRRPPQRRPLRTPPGGRRPGRRHPGPHGPRGIHPAHGERDDGRRLSRPRTRRRARTTEVVRALLKQLGELPDQRKAINYLMILVTWPAPTVRPPSRMANFRPSSMATGWISSTRISVLSPGMTISVPSGRFTTPVTSVVRK